MTGVETVLVDEEPDIILVEGDTNTVLASALAATKLGIKVGHVEAGLRSFDRKMPEEINRVLTDHISDYLFAPTEIARRNLQKEGIAEDKIFVTGNTVVDAVYQNSEIAKKNSKVLERFWLKKGQYFLITAHRQENVDVRDRFQGIVKGLKLLYNEFLIPIIFPIHPRTLKKMIEFNLHLKGVIPVDPVSFLDFLLLEGCAKLVLTDSGGVQEETCILKVPCVTLRDNTERPETIEVGSNVLVGTQPNGIVKGVKLMLEKERNWRAPFGDGNAGMKVVEILKKEL
jgi:UDP-N-acetylglucosamine 2-epimerase (non-hydrolysing)